VVLNNLPKRGNGKPSNVTLRGTSAPGLALRPQVKLVEGRHVPPGSSEVVAGRAVARGFEGVAWARCCALGRDWTVVGLFDAGKSGFDSEIWADAETADAGLSPAEPSARWSSAGRPRPSSVCARWSTSDPRLTLEAKREVRFYAEQSEALATFIRILGTALAVIFSIGAVVGAMITMFGSVASRVGEIGTLRALGFRRGAVLGAFLGEALLLSLVGGASGLAAASGMQAVDVSTTNFSTFAELAFQFTLTPRIALQSLLFALLMGVVGGFVPAWRAARLKIVDCLRAA
jgi:putative ABC transport system permease protein